MGTGIRRFTELRAWRVCREYKNAVYRLCLDTPLAKVEHGSRVAASGMAGGLLFTAGDDGTVRLRDAQTGFLVGTISGHGAPITHATISAQARYLLSADADGVVRITDIGRARWIWRIVGWPDFLPRLSTMVDDLVALLRGEGSGQTAGTGTAPSVPRGPGPTAR